MWERKILYINMNNEYLEKVEFLEIEIFIEIWI